MKALPLLAIPLLALIVCSCAGYERNWRRAVAAYEAGKTRGPAGPWIGTWTTPGNGHSGKLRAIVTPAAQQPGEYNFHYHATWAKVLSGTYKVRYPVIEERGRYIARGTEKMGVFGTFDHTATITEDTFQATYSSDKGDAGSFLLKRPEAGR